MGLRSASGDAGLRKSSASWQSSSNFRLRKYQISDATRILDWFNEPDRQGAAAAEQAPLQIFSTSPSPHICTTIWVVDGPPAPHGCGGTGLTITQETGRS